jgi:type I restriction enzyme, R subunit
MTENEIEQHCLKLLQTQGWIYKDNHEVKSLRGDYLSNVVLDEKLKDALAQINPHIDVSGLDYAIKRIKNLEGGELIDKNRLFCELLRVGIKVEQKNGSETIYQTVKIFDFENPTNNSFICTNQFTVTCDRETKRMDVVLIINGLPVVVLELKNPIDENTTVEMAFDQIQTYKSTISPLFHYNALLVASDGFFATVGSLTADYDRFLAWKSVDGSPADKNLPEIEVMIQGLLVPGVLLDIINSFTVFEQVEKDRNGIKQISYAKKVGAYHQYYAVNKAVESTQKARLTDKRAGVIWHTQGSGKSLSMVFYTGKIVKALGNPTVVVLTDRNDLDQQLFETFASSSDILSQKPVQAGSREHLKTLLKTSGGGIIFTTIQKFEEGADCLSDRDNIVVMADEAHRSQYGFAARENAKKEQVYGYAKYLHDALPNASFIGFTGTPIDPTQDVFGEYIDIYDIKQAVEDKATVPIYYESRIIKFEISDSDKQKLDQAVEETLDGVEDDLADKLKKQGLNLETVVGNPKRIATVASNVVEHFEARQQVLNGKAMMVCISRSVAVAMLEQIIKLRPDWHSPDISKGKIKVVMSDLESSNPNYTKWQQHLTKKADRELLANRLKEPSDELQMVIVVDMWLTGFDAPCLHTLYLDKIMKTHNLMQAIARVNRVFGSKPGGLVVDYIGIAGKLKAAMQMYTNNGGKGEVKIDQEEVLNQLEDKFSIVDRMFQAHEGRAGADYLSYQSAKDIGQKLVIIRQLTEYVLGLKDGKKRFMDNVSALKTAVALAIPNPRAIEISTSLVIFESIRSFIQKLSINASGKSESHLSLAIKQLVDQSLETGDVVDLFELTGIKKPELGILSDEFLADIKGLPQKNLALETLKKLLADEIKSRSKVNITQSKKFSDALTSILNRYHNNLLNSTEIIEEMINLAKDISSSDKLEKQLGLTNYEMAFYEALSQNESAAEVLEQDKLGELAKVLVRQINDSSKIDWANRTDAQAKIRLMIKRILRTYGYPPDMEKLAIDRILEQTKVSFEN